MCPQAQNKQSYSYVNFNVSFTPVGPLHSPLSLEKVESLAANGFST